MVKTKNVNQNFLIQLGHPKIQEDKLKLIDELQIFFINTYYISEESIYVFWHDIPCRFRYREDLNNNFDSFLALSWLIQKEPQGKTKVTLSNQILNIYWEVYWHGEEMNIKSKFEATEDLYAPYAEALNLHPEIKMNKTAFLAEWKTLLHQIIVTFKAVNARFEDSKEQRKWELLQQVESSIPYYGVIYAKQNGTRTA